jgi:hypothetical protein
MPLIASSYIGLISAIFDGRMTYQQAAVQLIMWILPSLAAFCFGGALFGVYLMCCRRKQSGRRGSSLSIPTVCKVVTVMVLLLICFWVERVKGGPNSPFHEGKGNIGT